MRENEKNRTRFKPIGSDLFQISECGRKHKSTVCLIPCQIYDYLSYNHHLDYLNFLMCAEYISSKIELTRRTLAANTKRKEHQYKKKYIKREIIVFEYINSRLVHQLLERNQPEKSIVYRIN